MITVSHNELFLASISNYSLLIIWDLETASVITEILLEYPDIISIIFLNDNKKIWIASGNNCLDYFDFQTQKFLNFFQRNN